jgi:hypothetical protein
MPVLPGPKIGTRILPSSRTLERVKLRLASRFSSVIDFSVFVCFKTSIPSFDRCSPSCSSLTSSSQA